MSDRDRLSREACRWWGRPAPSGAPATNTTSAGREVGGQGPPAPPAGGRREELAREAAGFWGKTAPATATAGTPTGTPAVPTPAPDRPFTAALLELPDGSAWVGVRKTDGSFVRVTDWSLARDAWKGERVRLTHTPPLLGTQSPPPPKEVEASFVDVAGTQYLVTRRPDGRVTASAGVPAYPTPPQENQ
ncbi:MAG: hypothetical protein U0871_10915 [Gemmataceae bacterium]